MSALKDNAIVNGQQIVRGTVLFDEKTQRRMIFLGYDAKVNHYIFLIENSFKFDTYLYGPANKAPLFLEGISHHDRPTENELKQLSIALEKEKERINMRDGLLYNFLFSGGGWGLWLILMFVLVAIPPLGIILLLIICMFKRS